MITIQKNFGGTIPRVNQGLSSPQHMYLVPTEERKLLRYFNLKRDKVHLLARQMAQRGIKE